MILDCPDEVRTHVELRFGQAGKAWADGVADFLSDCCDRWQLFPVKRLTGGLEQNIVLEVTARGEAAVLKLGYPDADQLGERDWLLAHQGRDCAQLLDSLDKPIVLLMERIVPGILLFDLIQGKEWSVERHRELANLLGGCTNEVPKGRTPSGYDQLLKQALDGAPDNVPQDFLNLVRDAIELLAELSRGPMGEIRWLHGDLHPRNILWDSVREFRAIDPKGYVGPAVMNTGRYLHNFLAEELIGLGQALDLGAQLALCEARGAVIADELGVSPKTLLKAAVVDLTLSLAFSVQGEGVGAWHRHRDLLEGLRVRC